MPKPGEAADIVLLDTQNDYAARVVDRTRAWNFQQGTMLYWNPEAPETQFFFNDRDPKTHEVFCVLFDISKGDERRAGRGVSLRGHADRQRRRGPARRLVPRHQLRPAGPAAAGDRLSGRPRLDGRPQEHPADDGVFKVNVDDEGEAAARLLQATGRRAAGQAPGRRREGAVHQPHALEPRRQPDLLLRPRRLRRRGHSGSTCRSR